MGGFDVRALGQGVHSRAKMKLLSLSSCFPSETDPNRGVFVAQRLAGLNALIPLEVVHPFGWLPLIKGKGVRPARAEENVMGLNVYHRRFLYLPGLMKHLDGRFYAAGIKSWLGKYFADHGKPDLLDVHFAWPDGVAASILAKRFNIPFSITLRGTLNSRIKNPKMRKQIAVALEEADCIISVSEPMAQIAADLGAKADKITVIPNGVNTELFRPVDKDLAREELSLSADMRYVLLVANMRPNKGLSELTQATAKLPDDVAVIVVGEDGDDGSYRKRLIATARQGGFESRLIFAGSQPHNLVPLYVNAADVCVLASHVEGCPNVVIEALACGKCVVSTSVGEVPNLITSDVNGYIVPPGDADALAEGINSALNRTWDAEVIRQGPAVRSWQKVAGDVVDVFLGRKVAGER